MPTKFDPLSKLRDKINKVGTSRIHPRPVSIQHSGMKVMVENPEGSLRHGISKDGKKWSTMMRGAHYGYFPHSRSSSNDGKSLDCFVGPHQNPENVYAIHTQDPKNKEYSEDKIFLGWNNPDEAKRTFLSHYDTPEHYRSMTTIPIDRFREMISRGKPDGVRWTRKHRRASNSLAIFSSEDTMSEPRLSFDAMMDILQWKGFAAEDVEQVEGTERAYTEDDHRRDSDGKFTNKASGGEPKKIGMRRYSVHPSANGTGYEVLDTLSGNKVVAHFPSMPQAERAAASRNSRQTKE